MINYLARVIVITALTTVALLVIDRCVQRKAAECKSEGKMFFKGRCL